MSKKEWIKGLQVGDEVALFRNGYSAPIIAPVVKITNRGGKTQVYLQPKGWGNLIGMDEGGYEITSKRAFTKCWILQATQEDRDRALRAELLEAIGYCKFDKLTTDQLQRIVGIINE